MKLFCISILYKGADKVTRLAAAHDLQSFGYFQRGSIREFMDFISKTVVERTSVSQRASVKEQEYMCHTFVRSDSIAGVVIADYEYPQRVAYTLLNKLLDDFAEKHGPMSWPTAKDGGLPFPDLEPTLAKYQNPKEADAMTKIQTDLDETKIILHNTIESVLQRGEKLDDLVDKSDALGMQSKTFYKTAKKTNQCCVIL